MSTLVSAIITGARAKFNDGYSDHFAKDDLSSQVDGVNTRFRLYNQNILTSVQGAPASLVVYKNLVSVTPTLTAAAGTFTLASAPAAGDRLSAEYYFALISDTDYLEFVKEATSFLGTVPTITATSSTCDFADGFIEAAKLYVASMGAGKMADLSSWYYQVNAGNKSFNKDQIAAKFQARSEALMAQAEKARDDYYTRYSQQKAAAANVSNVASFSVPYTPPR